MLADRPEMFWKHSVLLLLQTFETQIRKSENMQGLIFLNKSVVYCFELYLQYIAGVFLFPGDARELDILSVYIWFLYNYKGYVKLIRNTS